MAEKFGQWFAIYTLKPAFAGGYMLHLCHRLVVLVGRSLLPLLVALALAGCGLTKAQISAVQSFGKTSKDFVPMPATVLTANRDVYVVREAFETSTLTRVNGIGGAWRKSNSAADTYASETTLAAELTTALQILDRYASLLIELSSTEFTDANAKSAEALGKSLNEAVTSYNKLSNRIGKEDLPSIGPWVAAGVEFIGNLYIQKKQAEELRWYVAQGDPLIQNLTKNIDALLTDLDTNLLPAEEQQLKKALCDREYSAAESRNSSKQSVPHDDEGCPITTGPLVLTPTDADLLLDAEIKIREARQLAQTVRKATDQLRSSNQAILNSLKSPMSITVAIEEVTNLRSEVDKANKLRQSLSK